MNERPCRGLSRWLRASAVLVIATALKTASRIELEPGEHRVEILTIGQTEPVAWTFRHTFEGGHDYHVVRLEHAVTKSGPLILVLSDGASGEAARDLRLPCP